VYERGDALYAGRRFEYRNGTRVLLSAQPARLVRDPKVLLHADPLDLVKTWTVQVNLEFAAGPEVSTIAEYAEAHEWAQYRDGWLAVPYVLQDAKSAEQAEEIAATLPRAALPLLAAVFGIDPAQNRKQIIQRLVRACVPARAERRQG
jgi:hypothetical protein